MHLSSTIPLEERSRSQHHVLWCHLREDKCQVMIATTAFGLGINKLDVSFVVHFTVSQSVQNYYQESF